MRNPFILFHKKITVFLLLSLLIISLVIVLRFDSINFSENTSSILKGDQRTLDTSKFLDESVHDETWLAFVISCNDLYSKENLEKYFRLCELLKKTKWYNGQLGLENILVPKVLDKGKVNPRFELLIPNLDYEKNDWQEIKKLTLETSYIKNVVVSEDFSSATLLARFSVNQFDQKNAKDFLAEIDLCISKVQDSTFKIYKVGLPVLQNEIQTSLTHNLFTIGGIALLLISICLWYICKRFLYFGNLLASLLLSFLLLFFFVRYFEIPFDFYLLLLLPIIITVQLTFLVHMYTVMQKWELDTSLAKELIAEKTIKEIFYPSLSACLTTIAGLFSFMFSPIPELKYFGAFGGMATLLVLLISLGPSLSLLLFFYHKPKITFLGNNKNNSTIFTNFKITILPIICLIVLLGVSLFYLNKIKTDERVLQYLPEKSEMKSGLSILSERFGGIHLFQLEVDSQKNNGVNEASHLEYLLKIHEIAKKEPKISAVYSYAQLISQVNDKFAEAMQHSELSLLSGLLTNDKKTVDDLKVPNAILLTTIVQVLKKFNPHGLEILLDPGHRKSSIYIRTVDMPSAEYVELIQRVTNEAEKIKPTNVNLNLVKGLHEYMAKEELIKTSLLNSFLSSIVPILLIMVFFFRQFYYSFIAIFVNAAAITISLGFIGYMGISLNSITVLASSVAFGVAVDDSIHLITHFQELCRSKSPNIALEETYAKKNRAVIGTSLLVIFTAVFFWLLDFAPISNFGLVTIVSMTVALLFNLFVLPLLIKLSFRKVS